MQFATNTGCNKLQLQLTANSRANYSSIHRTPEAKLQKTSEKTRSKIAATSINGRQEHEIVHERKIKQVRNNHPQTF